MADCCPIWSTLFKRGLDQVSIGNCPAHFTTAFSKESEDGDLCAEYWNKVSSLLKESSALTAENEYRRQQVRTLVLKKKRRHFDF